MLIWMIEDERSGQKMYVKASGYEEMIAELKRIGFHSLLKPGYEAIYEIDIMVAERSNGHKYTADPYELPIATRVSSIPPLEQWPKHDIEKETKDESNTDENK